MSLLRIHLGRRVTPHIGGYVVEYEDFVMPLIVDNMRLFLAGRRDEMANIVQR